MFLPVSLLAQTDIDTLFSGFVDYEGKLIKKDSTGEYYKLKDFPGRIYYWSNDWYLKIFDEKYSTLVEGQISHRVCSQLVFKSGKWKSYYPDGQIKTEGYYERNQAIGLWRLYHPNGNLQKIYNLALIISDSMSAICMTGTYEEYYEDGHLKVSGLYFVVNDTTTVPQYDPETSGVKPMIVNMPVSKKTSKWLYYFPNGELDRKEDWEGILRKTTP